MNTTTTTNNNVTTGTRNFASKINGSRRFFAVLIALMLGGAAHGQARGQAPLMVIANGLEPVAPGSTVGFDATTVGENTGVALTVRNVGIGTLQFLGQPVVSGLAAGDFELNQLPPQVQPGGFAVLGISFVPTQAGTRTATITIPTNSAGTPNFIFTVTGTGLAAPQLLVADGLNAIEDGDTFALDEVEVGQSTGVALTIRNVGGAALEFTAPQNVIAVGADAADFDVALGVSSVAPGGFAVMTIGFTASHAGESTATIRIPTNAPNQENYSFIVTANAVEAPTASLSIEWDATPVTDGDTLIFGDVTVGETATSMLDLTSFGDAVLTISAFEFSGDAADDYSISETSVNLTDSTSVLAELKVAPSAAGTRSATLTIVNDGVDGNIVLLLSTEGVEVITDCNENGIDDADDLLNDSQDCNGNGIPDECETDTDDDGIIDACDNCVNVQNTEQDDFDGDDVGDLCDNCPETQNADQQDTDGDSFGNVCDNCPQTANADQTDSDADGFGDACDNCPQTSNPNQVDTDADGTGNACDFNDGLTNSDQPVDDQVDNNDQNNNDDQAGQDVPMPNGTFCGAGAMGMIPAMMFGLCGMRPRRRRA